MKEEKNNKEQEIDNNINKKEKKVKTEEQKELIRGIIIGSILLVIVLGVFIRPLVINNIENNESGNEEKETIKFSDEYKGVGKDNVFEIKSVDEIIKILEHGTGLVYLGFPECPWCQEYVIHLNRIAKENNAEKISYYNILNDRKNNTENYKKLVDLLDENLKYDDEGNKKIYVPAVIAVKDGKIVGFDDETSYDTAGIKDPKDYWTEEKLLNLESKLKDMIEFSKTPVCTDCNK